MATANPAMTEAAYSRAGRADTLAGVMTLQGPVEKTSLLVVLLPVSAAYTWSQAAAGDTAVTYWNLKLAGDAGG